ncbi:hypothetical protein BDZ97DRAFT_1652738 [Flammula alnicola]|nr:hypothetical protein BDZ97DRAFT_1652738 [Flammula alnicola]
MQSSSPTYNYPATPSGTRNPLQYRPLNSSPLVTSPGSPKMSSPVAAAQARRKSQYKARVPSTPTSTRNPARRLFSAGDSGMTYSVGSVEGDPQKVFLRNRFKARCFERAVKARDKAIRGKRSASMIEPSSDDYQMDDEEEEGDEDIMQDELFRRIMANTNRKQSYSFKVSYAQEVGSSFDPDIEDVNSWEQELAASNFADYHGASMPIASTSASAPPSELHWLEEEEPEELTPVDLDDEELEAYAEECAQRAALADFEDIPADELFYWNEEEELGTPTLTPTAGQHDDIMDMS